MRVVNLRSDTETLLRKHATRHGEASGLINEAVRTLDVGAIDVSSLPPRHGTAIKLIAVAVSFEAELYRQLQAKAGAAGVSANVLLDAAVAQHLRDKKRTRAR